MKTKLLYLLTILSLFIGNASFTGHHISGTITATVDGAAQTFNLGASAIATTAGGINGINITGSTENGDYGISIIVTSLTGSVTAGSYYSSGDKFQVQLIYASSSGTEGYGNKPFSSSTNAYVRITSINASGVQGSFSGKLAMVTGSGSSTKEITAGSFNVTFQ